MIVGVDGSVEALGAVRWAAFEARRRSAPLRLLHVCAPPPSGTAGDLAAARAWLHRADDELAEIVPQQQVELDLRVAEPVPVLINLSEHAGLMVVGAEGLGGFSAGLLGSTTLALATQGACPVVVTRGVERTKTRASRTT